jgi:hypothetical protein
MGTALQHYDLGCLIQTPDAGRAGCSTGDSTDNQYSSLVHFSAALFNPGFTG